MNTDYLSFLDYRAARRRLVKKFARPRWLLANVIAFVATMTGIWLYGTMWGVWRWEQSFYGPVLIGVMWSAALAVMSLILYRRSAASQDRREEIIEAEMRGVMHRLAEPADEHTLFAMHQQLEAEFIRESQWFVALTSFAVINALSWLISAVVWVGSSWPFQTTLPFALFFVGGIKVYLAWQQRQQVNPDERRLGWFGRLPLRHTVIYLFSSLVLMLASTARLINHWDAENIIVVWLLVLVAHTGLNVIVRPVIDYFFGKAERTRAAETEKPKHSERLLLGDDGEVLEIIDDEALQSAEGSLQDRA